MKFTPNYMLGNNVGSHISILHDSNKKKWTRIIKIWMPIGIAQFCLPGTFEDRSTAWLIVTGKPIFDKNAVFKGYLGATIDTIDQRELAEDFRSSRNRVNVFSALSSNFKWELNADLTYKWVSGAHSNWTGNKGSKVIGENSVSPLPTKKR